MRRVARREKRRRTSELLTLLLEDDDPDPPPVFVLSLSFEAVVDPAFPFPFPEPRVRRTSVDQVACQTDFESSVSTSSLRASSSEIKVPSAVVVGAGEKTVSSMEEILNVRVELEEGRGMMRCV